MKRINFTTTLLFLLILCGTAHAQERGDGIAEGQKKDPVGVISGRSGSGIGSQGQSGSNRWFSKNIDYANSPGYVRPFIKGLSDFGIKAGGNFQEMGTSPFTQQFTPGIVGGIYFRRFYRVTAFKIEALASSAHYESSQPAGYYTVHASDSVTKSSFKAMYISIPAMFELRLYRDLYIEVGPQYSYLLSSADKNGVFSKIYKQNDIFYKSEFSGLIGLEVNLPRKFKVDVRYIKGITDVNNSVYPKAYLQWQINSLQATLSYRLY